VFLKGKQATKVRDTVEQYTMVISTNHSKQRKGGIQMSGINLRDVFMRLMIIAFLVVFFPAGSAQAAEGMCTDCKCHYTCELKSKNIEVLYKTFDGCWWQRGLEGGCKICGDINLCTQMGSWFKKCEDAGGTYVQVECWCYTNKARMQAANTFFGNIQECYPVNVGCKTKNTKFIPGPFGVPIPIK
jgi:hypothetical protein